MRKISKPATFYSPSAALLSPPSSPGLSRATLHYPPPARKIWKRKGIKGTHPSSRLNMLMQSPQTPSPSVWPKLNGAPSCSPEFVAAKQSSKTWKESGPPRPLPGGLTTTPPSTPRLFATQARSQRRAATSFTRSPPPSPPPPPPPSPPLARPSARCSRTPLAHPLFSRNRRASGPEIN